MLEGQVPKGSPSSPRFPAFSGCLYSLAWSFAIPLQIFSEMATHSSILAWRIPWREKPGRLQSTGSQRVYEANSHTYAHQSSKTSVVQEFFSGYITLVLHIHSQISFGSLKKTCDYTVYPDNLG